MSFESELAGIQQEVPGCKAAILMTVEGLLVTKHLDPDATIDLELILVEMTTAMKRAWQAFVSAAESPVEEMTLACARGTLLVRFLSEEYVVALWIDPTEFAGRGQFSLRRHQLALSRELS